MKKPFGEWQPIAALDKSEYQFVLVHEDGAKRTLLWNALSQQWEHPHPWGQPVHPDDNCYDPDFFMELPENPKE